MNRSSFKKSLPRTEPLSLNQWPTGAAQRVTSFLPTLRECQDRIESAISGPDEVISRESTDQLPGRCKWWVELYTCFAAFPVNCYSRTMVFSMRCFSRRSCSNMTEGGCDGNLTLSQTNRRSLASPQRLCVKGYLHHFLGGLIGRENQSVEPSHTVSHTNLHSLITFFSSFLALASYERLFSVATGTFSFV